MGWDSIIGHADVQAYLQAVLAAGRVASAYLFSGPEGIGKRTLARIFAQALLCEGNSNAVQPRPCGLCAACQQVAANSHPDLISIARPPEKASIPIELFIGVDGKMQEGLCHDLSLKPFRGGRKIAIVDDADFINEEGANSLLKTLEEPPPGSVLILIGTSPARQLPTIRSRCQRVQFQALSAAEVGAVLQRLGSDEEAAGMQRLAQASGGSVQRALALRDPEVLEFRGNLLRQLASGEPASDQFGKALAAFIERAGSDNAAKRDRMRLIASWALEFYSAAFASESDSPRGESDSELQAYVAQWQTACHPPAAAIARVLERSLDAYNDIALNVNQGIWVDCWLAEIGTLGRGEFAATRYV